MSREDLRLTTVCIQKSTLKHAGRQVWGVEKLILTGLDVPPRFLALKKQCKVKNEKADCLFRQAYVSFRHILHFAFP